MLYEITKPLVFCVLKCMFGLEVFGRDNIPQKEGFILASNHVSYLDPIVLGAACPRKLNFMAKKELFDSPFWSFFVYAGGAFPVDRNTADLSAMKEAMRRIKRGKALALFPQGRRVVGEFPTAPNPGIGFLAAKLDVPVIPVFIKGTEVALPPESKKVHRAKIIVFFGKQVFVEKRLSYQGIATSIMENVSRLSYAS